MVLARVLVRRSFDVLAAAVRTGDLFLLMPNDGQSFRKGFLAVTAEEFVVGHGDLQTDEA